MALTNTEITKDRIGSNSRIWVGSVAFDSSYTTGGMSFKSADIGFTAIDAIVVSQSSGYVVTHDTANNKLLVYRQKDPAAAGGADIALTEVANGVSLATLTIRVVVFGR